jgi:plastocyanin
MRNRHQILAAASMLAALVLACGSDSSTSTAPSQAPPPPAGRTAITIQGTQGAQSFAPAMAHVPRGQIVEWRNMHTDVHDLNDDFGRFETGPIVPGTTSRTLRMDVPGTYPYHCIDHPGMVGTIVVSP